jgi:hypothetical protein
MFQNFSNITNSPIQPQPESGTHMRGGSSIISGSGTFLQTGHSRLSSIKYAPAAGGVQSDPYVNTLEQH